jgi:hypothetical protein
MEFYRFVLWLVKARHYVQTPSGIFADNFSFSAICTSLVPPRDNNRLRLEVLASTLGRGGGAYRTWSHVCLPDAPGFLPDGDRYLTFNEAQRFVLV